MVCAAYCAIRAGVPGPPSLSSISQQIAVVSDLGPLLCVIMLICFDFLSPQCVGIEHRLEQRRIFGLQQQMNIRDYAVSANKPREVTRTWQEFDLVEKFSRLLIVGPGAVRISVEFLG